MAVLPIGPGPLTGAYVISEANDMYRSREEADVDGGEEGLDPGTLLAGDGSVPYIRAGSGAVVTAILWEGIPAYSGADPYVAGANVVRRTIHVRDMAVHKTELIYPSDEPAEITAADDALRGLGIIPRL